jgi:DNA-directed RNA polymerase subunit RPC12/RpoP
MIKCKKCKRNMMIDRVYNSVSHLEIYCFNCGSRKFFHPPSDSEEGTWLLKKEIERAKITIAPL